VLLQALQQFSDRVDRAIDSQKLGAQFHIIKVWITRKVLSLDGLKYVMGKQDLVVIPYQTLSVYLPAIGDRLKVLNHVL